MNKYRILRGLKFVAFGALFILLAGGVTMTLWNWLMPALFQLPVLGFGQALGLLVLSRILLGGFGRRGGGSWGGGPRRHYWAQRMRERWEKMTPEERLQWQAKMQDRCGPRGWRQQPWDRPAQESTVGQV